MTSNLALLLSGALLLAGCATSDDPSTYDIYQDEMVINALGLQYEDLDRPGIFDDLGVFGGSEQEDAAYSEAQEARMQELEQALARLEAERGQERAPNLRPLAVDGPRTRVAVVLDTPARQRLDQAFTTAARNYPVRLLNDTPARAALSDAGCDVETAGACADELRRYPGIRMLVTVTGEDNGRVAVRYHDLETGGEPATSSLALPEVDGRVPKQALESLADQVLAASLEHARVAPWLARTFSREDQGWAINAGQASGLETGDQLRVHRPGRVIRSPSGRAAGWIRGEAVGTVEVNALAGEDVAVVTLVDGQAPGEEDVLIPVE